MPSLLQSAYRNQQDDEYDSSEYCTATSDEESEEEVSVRNGIQFVKVLVRNTYLGHENNYSRHFSRKQNTNMRLKVKF